MEETLRLLLQQFMVQCKLYSCDIKYKLATMHETMHTFLYFYGSECYGSWQAFG